ncbi:hypothetical protein [Luedemannella helvata]|uniref:Uncharacterized protein n=1 Tax=Luedemannella helvata TaxID=349315 RepID=A0ABN2JRA7_9ACTN
MTVRDGYVATWQGKEYEVSPDGDEMRLYATEPEKGFAPVRVGRYLRIVLAKDVTDFAYVRTTCRWRGEPFIVLAEQEGWLRVEYTGGKYPVAQALGLEEFDFGVYQGWAPASEVTDVREQRV